MRLGEVKSGEVKLGEMIQLVLTNANDIAPLRPANHITHCILRLITLLLQIFDKIESGNVLKNRPIKQNSMHRIKNMKFQCLNFPVNIPIPM